MEKYIGGKQANELLGVHQRTLMNWDKIGKIETIRTAGNKRLYNVSKFIKVMFDLINNKFLFFYGVYSNCTIV